MKLVDAVRQDVTTLLATHIEGTPPRTFTEQLARDTVILVANRIEAINSPLCNCRRDANTPRNWRTGAYLDHHCDCAAVTAARRLLEGLAYTLHAEQCPGCR